MARAICLDTSVLIQYLVPEELQAQAEALVLEAVEAAVKSEYAAQVICLILERK